MRLKKRIAKMILSENQDRKITSVEVHSQLLKHFDVFKDFLNNLCTNFGCKVSFSDIYLPDPNVIKEGYDEECRVEWPLEVKIDDKYFLSYVVVLDEDYSFDRYGVLFSDEELYRSYGSFEEAKEGIKEKLEESKA
jgi:hypothetical protein